MASNPAVARAPRLRLSVILGFAFAAALSRLIPHPPNFTPVGALALFCAAYLGSRALALLVPIFTMFLADAVLAVQYGWELDGVTLVIYACIAASVWIGGRLSARVGPGSVAVASLLSASLFFVVTNFAVWCAYGLYPTTPGGLLECYIAALPFFGNTLLGYAAYGLALFGGFEWLSRRCAALAPPLARGV